MIKISKRTLFAFGLALTMVNSFSMAPSIRLHQSGLGMTSTKLESEASSSAKLDSSESPSSAKLAAGTLRAPLGWTEMVRQAASAMRTAAEQGKTRQIVRILLPRESSSGSFGQYLESTSKNLEDAIIVPPDESWQGGIMQLYRAAAPTCTAILREATKDVKSGLPPRVSEDRSVDESGVDGVGLFTTDDNSIACWVQPTQENVDALIASSRTASPSDVVVLMNPQWRLVDDALDSASKGEGLFSQLASFLGGKGGVLKRIKEEGFEPVYTLEGYVCRGANVRLLQVLDSDWAVFCERDDAESYLPVGTAPTRPNYQQVEEMLQQADIGFKFSRDMGLSPKL